MELAKKHRAYASLTTLGTLRVQLDLPNIATEESSKLIGYNLRSKHDAYVLREQLGSGAFGTVYRALDLDRDCAEVALKQIKLKGTYSPKVRSRLLQALRREIQSCASIEHPGVAKVMAWGEDTTEQVYYITQEYIRGPTLRTFMEDARPSIFDSVQIIKDVCAALTVVHNAGIVHCDLKPDNIIIRDGRTPVLVDFGIARLSSQDKQEANSGTRLYMSPESLLNLRPEPSVDLYAVGLILMEMLGSSLPEFSNTSLINIFRRQRILHSELRHMHENKKIASWDPLSDIIKNLLKLRISGRPKAASSVAAWLENILKENNQAG